jgi:cyclic-di-GMP-binding protein
MLQGKKIDLGFLRDSKQIKHWVEGLPVANIQAAAERILYTLQEINRTPVPLRAHLEFLEGVGPAVSVILQQLRRHCADATFPIPAKTQQVAQFVQDMLETLIVGYQAVLRQLLSAPPPAGNEAPYSNLFQQISHRIFFYSFLVLQSNALLDQPCRKNIWIRLNRLYMRAQREERHTKAIDFPGFKDYSRSNIDLLYKKILLLSLIPLYSLRSEQVQELIASLEAWAEAMDLVPCYPGANRKQMPFQIDPEQDLGPISAGTGCDICVQPRCVLIDTGRLQTLLTQLVMQAARRREDRVSLASGATVTVKTLETLKTAWKERPKRNDRRAPINALVELVVSLSGIHHALSGLRQEEPHHPATQRPTAKPRHGSLFDTGILELGDQPVPHHKHHQEEEFGFPPVGNPALDALFSEPHEGPWQARKDTSGYRFLHAAQKDRSENGCQLELRTSQETRLRVGELLGLRDSPDEPLRLGVIRWIKQSEHASLNCGLLNLAQDVRPAAVILEAAETRSEKIECLVARHVRSGKTLLIVPFMAGLRGKRLTLLYGPRRLPIAFTGWPVEHSRSFEAFEFGVPKHNSNLPNSEVPLFTLELLDSLIANPDQDGGAKPKGVF